MYGSMIKVSFSQDKTDTLLMSHHSVILQYLLFFSRSWVCVLMLSHCMVCLSCGLLHVKYMTSSFVGYMDLCSNTQLLNGLCFTSKTT